MAFVMSTCLVSQRVLSPDKGKRTMLVPRTSDGFRATVGALRSIYGSNDVILHTSLPKDSCLLLLDKKLGRQTSEEVVLAELGTMGMCMQGVLQHH